MNLDYDKIFDEQNRSYTHALLDLLISDQLPYDEILSVIETLKELDDPRSWIILKDIALNTENPNKIREYAVDILIKSSFIIDHDDVLCLWRSNDFLIKKLALWFMDKNDEELVLNIAYDKKHELNKDAIKLICTFTQFMNTSNELVLDLMTYEDSELLKLALDFFYWDEPSCAEPYIINATYNRNIEIVLEAIKTLEFYKSIKVMKRLIDLKLLNQIELKESLDMAYDSIRNDFLFSLKNKNTKVSKHIKNWLKPIWELLAYTKEELEDQEDEETNKYENRKLNKPKIFKDIILKNLLDLNTSPLKIEALFCNYDWSLISKEDRNSIIEIIKKHPDPEVRDSFCSKLAQWNDQEALLYFINDSVFQVQASAIYNIGNTEPKSDEIAKLLLEHLKKKNVTGCHERTCLESYIQHASNRNEVVENLFLIANNIESSENLRYTAIENLIKFECVDKLQKLVWIINDIPRYTWSLHIFILEAASKFNIDVNIAHLLEIDNLYLQEALALLITPN